MLANSSLWKVLDLLNFFAFIFGTVIGSFINVCIYRIPKGESIIYPPSHCPRCGYHLRPIDLIPLLSYILLRGRCRKCSAPISSRYLFVELLTGVIFLLAFLKFGFTFDFLAAVILIICLLTSALIDLEYQIIPDRVVLPTAVIGLLLTLLLHRENLSDRLLGLAVGGGTILLVVVLSRGGMGGGDIELFTTVGMYMGLRLTALAVLLSFIFGSIAGLILILLKYKKMKDAIPFGPFIALGSIVSLFMGQELINLYFNLFLYY